MENEKSFQICRAAGVAEVPLLCSRRMGALALVPLLYCRREDALPRSHGTAAGETRYVLGHMVAQDVLRRSPFPFQYIDVNFLDIPIPVLDYSANEV